MLKNIYYYAFFMLTFLSVNQFSAQKYEIINSKSIKLNGTLPLFGTKADLLKKLGKNIIITEGFPECGAYDEDAQKGTRFYKYSKTGIEFYVYGNKTEFQNIDLQKYPKNFVDFGKFRISGKTTVEELKKFFPVSYRNYLNEKDGFLMRFKFNSEWDDEIQIMIEKGKVSGVYYWSAC